MKKKVYIHALEAEQYDLWYDLLEVIARSTNGYWSIGVESVIDRIVRNARVIGLVTWKGIPVALLEAGIYKAVAERFELEYEPVGDLTRFVAGVDYTRWGPTLAELTRDAIETM